MYNSTTGAIDRNPIWNSLSLWLQKNQWKLTNINPEDLCYFGFEGNPHFTARLQALAQPVMNTASRPLKIARFFTESVVTNVSGPTTLFIDGIGLNSNFDGSSIISTMTRIKQSKKQTNGVEAASAMGYTLTDIIKMTVQTSGDDAGGYLYIQLTLGVPNSPS
jgi:hypothetical protein